MASQEQRSRDAGQPSRLKKSALRYPECPNCGRSMTIKQVVPVLFAKDVDDVVYGCDECGTEMKRSVRRD